MSDLISRKEAIEKIESHTRVGDELYPLTDTDKILNHAFEIAASCVYNLPSAQPEQRWIPVTVRLPKDYEDVLVWYEYFKYGEYNRMVQTCDVGYYISEFNRWGGVTGQKVRAIAWMPLPEPYKEDDHETD